MSYKDLHNFQQDLILNESFIRWVKSDFQEEDVYWSDFIDKHPENETDINAAIRFVISMSFNEDFSIDHDKLWERISNSTKQNETSSSKIRSLNFYKIGTALLAACLLFFVVFRIGIPSTRHISTGIAQDLVEKLPDGSSVRLDAASEISYVPKKWKEERIISLKGLAFFEVKKGERFLVETDLGIVKVLGTSFSVDSRDNHFEVICKTGKVAVMNKATTTDEIILTPGDKVILSDGLLKLIKAEIGKPNEIIWINGVYTFDNQPLSDVIRELERQYDIKVYVGNTLTSTLYTGFFRKGNLKDALHSVTWPLGMKFTIDGNKVSISK